MGGTADEQPSSRVQSARSKSARYIGFGVHPSELSTSGGVQ
jgi:hypothetical protein